MSCRLYESLKDPRSDEDKMASIELLKANAEKLKKCKKCVNVLYLGVVETILHTCLITGMFMNIV